MIPTFSENSELKDTTGRKISYLRVSLTQRCNFRCQYCYGEDDGNKADPAPLADEELLSLIAAFARLGVNKIRLTGGEPLLKPSIIEIVSRISQIEGIELIGLTTNGYLLKPKLYPLIDAGLRRLNISLDSLNRDTFCSITGFDGLLQVLSAVELAEKSGVFPMLKVNTVVMRGINDHEICDFGRWALNRKIDLRFIEYMPVRSVRWGVEKYISENEIRDNLKLDLEPDSEESDIHSPARCFKVKGYPGRISFISAQSRAFCGTCNRLRLTSSGELIGCLFREKRYNLKPLLVLGKSIQEIAHSIHTVVSESEFRRLPMKENDTSIPYMKVVGG
jgi:cyclic pyranopterin phosphate synthase